MRLMIALADGFEEIEALTPIDVLRRLDFIVQLVGVTDEVVTSKTGVKVLCDRTLEEVKAEEYDGIILPGGPGYKNLLDSKKLAVIIKELNERGKLIAAICASPLILVELGLLADKKATCYPSLKEKIPNWVDEAVVVDKNIITSQGPGTALAFALAIAEYFGKSTEELKKALLV